MGTRARDGALGVVGAVLLVRIAASVAAEVLARCVFGGSAPVGVRFVEGRYGLVPFRSESGPEHIGSQTSPLAEAA